MKYLQRFLASQDAPPEICVPDPGAPYKTDETPRQTGSAVEKTSAPDPAAPYETYETAAPIPPARPATPPTYGYTVGMHVVELAGRTPADEARDPVRLVAGIGWPEWCPVGTLESAP